MDYARYVVQPGDSIYKIAKAYQVDMNEIIRLNQLKNPERIYPGQILLLPIPEHESGEMETEIPEPNFTYARWLYDLYAGKESMLTFITTYLYQTVVIEQPEFDNLLKPIIIDKINCLTQLGMCLCKLGVDPRYGSFQQDRWVDWRSTFVNYSTELCPILCSNMEMESRMAQHTMELCHRIPVPEIQALLSQISADCQRHCQCFAEAKEAMCPGYSCPPTNEGMEMPEIPVEPRG